MRRRLSYLSLIGAVALVASACGGASDDDAAPGGNPGGGDSASGEPGEDTSDQTLAGTEWRVESVAGESGEAQDTTDVWDETTVTFSEDGEVGFRICNTGGGTYEVDGDTLVMSEMVSTMMACEGPLGDAELAFLALADSEVTYTIEADLLTLTGADGSLVLQSQG